MNNIQILWNFRFFNKKCFFLPLHRSLTKYEREKSAWFRDGRDAVAGTSALTRRDINDRNYAEIRTVIKRRVLLAGHKGVRRIRKVTASRLRLSASARACTAW